MPGPRPLVLLGQVIVDPGSTPPRMTSGVALADGRVVAVGDAADVRAALHGGQVLDFGSSAIVPGLHDFHLHLVGMARARRELQLDAVAGFDELVGAVAEAAARLPAEAWLRGRGWYEAVLASGDLQRLGAATAGRPTLLISHDGHSAWVSPAALTQADLAPGVLLAGGRVETGADGKATGVLRERAADVAEAAAGRLGGAALDAPLDEVLRDLARMGITAATDAGDATTENGVGTHADLGDRASELVAHRSQIDGSLRLAINVPAAGIEAAAGHGWRTGRPLASAGTVRAGWAKVYTDGALGSQTGACFEAYTCGDGVDAGILRLSAEELRTTVRRARRAGISLALHAIGDRAAAFALDALEAGPASTPGSAPDRLEHLQLLRPADAPRLASLGVTASLQPIHCAADRPIAERCWADRLQHVYATRRMADAGTRLAFGSDAPIESSNPWHGIFAAAHRRFPGDGTPDWHPEQAIDARAALAAYTRGAAAGIGATDEGHLLPGARADLAVLNVDAGTLLDGDERLAMVESVLTLVDGRESHRA